MMQVWYVRIFPVINFHTPRRWSWARLRAESGPRVCLHPGTRWASHYCRQLRRAVFIVTYSQFCCSWSTLTRHKWWGYEAHANIRFCVGDVAVGCVGNQVISCAGNQEIDRVENHVNHAVVTRRGCEWRSWLICTASEARSTNEE